VRFAALLCRYIERRTAKSYETAPRGSALHRNKLKPARSPEHNSEHHLALLLMYATGTRVSQALRLKGIDVFADPITGAHSIRLPKAKRGHSRSYRVIQSADPVRDLSPIVDLARQREVPSYSGASPVITCTWSSRSTRGWQASMRKWFIATLFGTPGRRCSGRARSLDIYAIHRPSISTCARTTPRSAKMQWPPCRQPNCLAEANRLA
jgi:hypothetical protein